LSRSNPDQHRPSNSTLPSHVRRRLSTNFAPTVAPFAFASRARRKCQSEIGPSSISRKLSQPARSRRQTVLLPYSMMRYPTSRRLIAPTRARYQCKRCPKEFSPSKNPDIGMCQSVARYISGRREPNTSVPFALHLWRQTLLVSCRRYTLEVSALGFVFAQSPGDLLLGNPAALENSKSPRGRGRYSSPSGSASK
jgi:hypothetical protein